MESGDTSNFPSRVGMGNELNGTATRAPALGRISITRVLSRAKGTVIGSTLF